MVNERGDSLENKVYIVSEKRKLLWKLEVEILAEFQRICEKHSLKYFAIGGTLLGAVRHQGFIPWDDDIDLAMMREDYEKFICIAKDEMNEPFFLQTPDTDTGYYYGHLKIRMNGTTCIRRSEWAHKMPFHQGVFIDVFPLDAVPDSKAVREIHRFLAVKSSSIARSAPYDLSLGDIKKKNRRKFRIYRKILRFVKPIRFSYLRDQIVQMYNKRPTKEIGQLGNAYKYYPNFAWERQWFDETVDVPFEGLTLKAPAGYDYVLTKLYGDWKTPTQNGNYHGELFFDAENPYTDYLDYYNMADESSFL